jgi:hypothetical protein
MRDNYWNKDKKNTNLNEQKHYKLNQTLRSAGTKTNKPEAKKVYNTY